MGGVADSDFVKRRAPDVDPGWAEAFVWSLQVRGIQGGTLVKALTKVNHAVHVSGFSAEEIFGPPESYAASLPAPEEPSGFGMFVLVIPPILGFVGLLLVGYAVPPLHHGRMASLSLGWVITLAALVAGVVIPVVLRRRVIAFFERRPFVTLGVGAALLLAAFVPAQFIHRSLALFSPRLMLGGGVVLLALTSYLYVRNARAAVPLEPPPGWDGEHETLGRPGLGWAIAYPVGAVGLAVLQWFIH